MDTRHDDPTIQDLLGSVHILSYTMGEIVEENLLHKVAGEQLTLPQMRLMKLVSSPGTHTITGVAAFMGISKAAASKAADRLVRGGLMRRTEGEKDRRAAHLALTPAGKKTLGAFDSARMQMLREIAGTFPSDELQGAIRVLDTLAVRLIRERADMQNVCVRCRIHFLDKCLMRQHLKRECHYEMQRQRFQKKAE